MGDDLHLTDKGIRCLADNFNSFNPVSLCQRLNIFIKYAREPLRAACRFPQEISFRHYEIHHFEK